MDLVHTTTSNGMQPHACIKPRLLSLQLNRSLTLHKGSRQQVVLHATANADAKQTIVDNLASVKGRGKEGLSASQLSAIELAVEELEREQGIQDPTASGKLDGRWKLLYTTRPGTASPIQRTFIGVDSFTVYQDIDLSRTGRGRVNNVVVFGKGGSIGQLKVEAEANTDNNPLPGFKPRRGAGLALFGKSSSEPPTKKNLRIDFQFDRAAFDFKKFPIKIPYPVPFKLLGDETKGWIDITYLSSDGKFRLSRGNKGTLFILALEE